jgi:hypothetical protein
MFAEEGRMGDSPVMLAKRQSLSLFFFTEAIVLFVLFSLLLLLLPTLIFLIFIVTGDRGGDTNC